MDLSLDFLFCSIDLYFCLCASTILSWWLWFCSRVWSQAGWFLQFHSSFSRLLWLFEVFTFVLRGLFFFFFLFLIKPSWVRFFFFFLQRQTHFLMNRKRQNSYSTLAITNVLLFYFLNLFMYLHIIFSFFFLYYFWCILYSWTFNHLFGEFNIFYMQGTVPERSYK